jgi:hypothetical protein
MTGKRFSMTRVPPNGPAETPQMPTALCVYVLAQVRVQRVLEQPRIAVVVLRHNQYQRVGSRNRLGESGVLDGAALVRAGKIKLADVDQLALDARALAELAED